MSRFVLTAQIRLAAPTNTRQVVNQIQNQLSGVNVPLNLGNTTQTQRQLAQVNQQLKQTNNTAQKLGKNFGVAIKRFAAFAVATRAVSLFTNGLSAATDEAIEFQRELVKIAQVTGKATSELQGLQNTITNLATGLGTSSRDLLSTTRILAQAGIAANDLDTALSALAKTTLAPTFEDIEKTTEGAVAIINQFKLGVGALESQLGSINAVAGQFAVESGDLISAVRRTGGVFKSAGGDLNELLALFTSVRATTRESSESIATGLRTILTRIQRPSTIEFLKQFGVELTNLENKFVGPFEAIGRLSEEFAGLEQGDIRFVKVAEELGGFRQIGKVIPLLQQYRVAQEALQAAQAGTNSLSKDAETAQEALAVQITKTKEQFLALVRSLTETSSFQTIARLALRLADSFIAVADAIKPILPILAGVGLVKLASGVASFGKGIAGGIRTRNQGGPIGFASGGVVPGTGNGDTVPAMLTPGEFVIRKSSVNKIGAGTLAAMNENKYAAGGFVKTGSMASAQGAKTLFANRDRIRNWSDDDSLAINYGYIPFFKKYPQAKSNNLYNAYKSASGYKERGDVFERLVSSVTGQPLTANNDFLDFPNGEAKSDKKFLPIGGGGIGLPAYKTVVAKKFNASVRELRRRFTPGVDKVRPNEKVNIFYDDLLKKFFGGHVQKFANGGLIESKKVGAAILNLDKPEKRSDSVRVEGADVKAKFSQFKDTKLGFDPISKFYQATNFKLTRQGLDKETRNKFRKAIDSGLLSGIDTATSSLSQDLGLGSIKLDNNSKENFLNSQRGAIFGDFFESTLASISNKGVFGKPDSPNRPFDFPNGITGPLSDNYKLLPKSFIDAKTSFKEASDDNFKTKIVNQVRNELIDKGILKDFTPKIGNKTFDDFKNSPSGTVISPEELGGKFTDLRKQLPPGFEVTRQQGKSAFKKLARGGEGSSTDTVPALLTPGEFVINSKAASRIGRANLETMNKKGVAGFATGGAVGPLFNGPAREDVLISRSQPRSTSFSDDLLSNASKEVADNMAELAEKTTKEAKAIVESNKNRKDSNESIKRNTKAKEQESNAGIFSSLALASSFLPRVQDASTGLERLQNSLVDSTTSILFVISALDAFGLRLNTQTVFGGAGAIKGAGTKARYSTRKGLNRIGLSGPASRKVAKSVGSLANAFSKGLGPVAAITIATVAASKSIDAYSGVHEKANKAIEEGNVAQAASLQNASRVQSDANKAAVGLAVTFGGVGALVGGPFGAAIGATIGGLAGLALKAEFAEGAVNSFRDNILTLFGSDSASLVRKKATADAQLAKNQLELAENTKAADEAIKSFKEEGGSASEAIKLLGANARNTLQSNKANIDVARQQFQDTKNGVGTLPFFGPDPEEIKSALEELKKTQENALKSNDRALQELTNSPLIRGQINRAVSRGGETIDPNKAFQDFFSTDKSIDEAIGNIISAKQADDFRKSLANMVKAAQENADFLKSLNFGLRSVEGAVGAASITIDKLIAEQESSFNKLGFATTVLETAITSAGTQIDDNTLNSSLSIVSDAFKKFGGDSKIVDDAIGTIRGLNEAQKNAETALTSFKDSASLSELSPEGIKTELTRLLLDTVPDDSPIRDRLQASVRNLEIDDEIINQIRSGNISGVIEETFGDLIKSANGNILSISKNIAEQQQKLSNEISKRIELESKLADAQRRSIDIQIEAAQALEEFGGPLLTANQKIAAANEKLDISLRNAGLGGSGGTSAGALIGAQERILGSFASQGNFSGPDSDQRAQLEAAQGALVETIKQRIAITKEELQTIKEKNRLERESLEKLTQGDILGFIQDQAASSAASVLRTGDQQLARLFDPATLGKAFSQIRESGTASSEELRRSARATLGAFASDRNVGVLSGTTAEESALNSQGQDFARALGIAGNGEAQIQEMKVNTQQVLINSASVALRGTQGFATGGAVYANRGMFIPRGSDTVPAMLTPGEFVINRAAVQRGNNLQILKAINSGSAPDGAQALSSGGAVRYMQNGGSVSRDDSSVLLLAERLDKIEKNLSKTFNNFSNTVDKFGDFTNTDMRMELDSRGVSVNINGAAVLKEIMPAVNDVVLKTIQEEIKNLRQNQSGDVRYDQTVLGTF